MLRCAPDGTHAPYSTPCAAGHQGRCGTGCVNGWLVTGEQGGEQRRQRGATARTNSRTATATHSFARTQCACTYIYSCARRALATARWPACQRSAVVVVAHGPGARARSRILFKPHFHIYAHMPQTPRATGHSVHRFSSTRVGSRSRPPPSRTRAPNLVFYMFSNRVRKWRQNLR